MYGFGSRFSSLRRDNSDIDVLVVHNDKEAASIQFAILCKRLLTKAIPTAHVTMLSVDEERELCFRQKSGAVLLGDVVEKHVERDISKLAESIAEAQVKPRSRSSP